MPGEADLQRLVANFAAEAKALCEKAAREVLALPVHSALAEQDLDYVCQQVRAFYA